MVIDCIYRSMTSTSMILSLWWPTINYTLLAVLSTVSHLFLQTVVFFPALADAQALQNSACSSCLFRMTQDVSAYASLFFWWLYQHIATWTIVLPSCWCSRLPLILFRCSPLLHLADVDYVQTAQPVHWLHKKSLETISDIILNWLWPKFAAKKATRNAMFGSYVETCIDWTSFNFQFKFFWAINCWK